MECSQKPAPCARYRAVATMLADDPKLLEFLFGTSQTQLKGSPALLRCAAKAFSSGEQILVNSALDLWSDDGRTSLSDLAFRLDARRLRNVLTAVCCAAAG
jgi:hypothetical protein